MASQVPDPVNYCRFNSEKKKKKKITCLGQLDGNLEMNIHFNSNEKVHYATTEGSKMGVETVVRLYIFLRSSGGLHQVMV